jgi:hypothetical protein
MGGRDSHRPLASEATMPYSYIPGSQGGDPARALRILIKVLLYASLVGFFWMLLKRKRG